MGLKGDTLETKLLSEYDSSNDANKEKFKPLQGFEKNAICSYVNGIGDSITSTILKRSINSITNSITIPSDSDRSEEDNNNFLTKTGTGLLQSINTYLELTPTDVDFSKISFETCSN